jgi:hypothetical protein
MAEQSECLTIPMAAAADYSAKQWYLVTASANNTATLCSAATDAAVGVLQNGGETGAGLSVAIAGHSKVKLGDVVSAGALVGPDTSGRAVTITAGSSTTAYAIGRCISGGNTNEIGTIVLCPAMRAA